MRLLVVGHPFIVAYHQKKYAAMKQLDPRLELRIVGPKVYRHPFRAFSPEVHAGLNPEEVVPLSFALYRTHMTYLLDPMRMAALLRDFRPDVIHAEEEPHAFITVETLSLGGMFAPQAVVSLFTWDNLDRPRSFPVRALKHGLRAYSLRRAAAVVCGNREAEQLLRARTGYAGITAVLPQYGLDPSDHLPGHEPALRQQLGLSDAVSVGYVGRLVPEKGIELLLDALAQLTQHPWKLLLVGSGPLERAIREQWMPRFPGRIVHVPAVPHGEVPCYLRCLDIFVLASYAAPNWKEQFGLALVQAMMTGLACIGSSSGAIPEVLGPGGLIFAERDSKSLAEALKCLLASPDRRSELSGKAREFALRNYTSQRLAARYLHVFEEARRAAVMRKERQTSRPENVRTILGRGA